jgi:hypothetical protein
MNINWKAIQKKYPKTFGKFLSFLEKEKKINGYRPFMVAVLYQVMENNLVCFCDLEKFFDDNEIRIFILPYYANIGSHEEYQYIIITQKVFKSILHGTRGRAKEQAIDKAFEVLEGML